MARGQIEEHIKGAAFRILCTDDGDICLRLLMFLHDFIQRNVCHDICAANQHVLALVLVEHVADRAECLQRGTIVFCYQRRRLRRKCVRRKQEHAAALARQIPILAGTEVIEQRLILVAHQNGYLITARVHEIGHHKVNHAIAAAKRHRRYRTVLGQLAQVIIAIKSNDNSQCIFHSCSSPHSASGMS